MPDRKRSILGDTIKLLLALGIVGGVLYYFFADEFTQLKDVANVEMNYDLSDVDDDLQGPVGRRLQTSLLWRSYFKHIPAKERTEEAYTLRFMADFHHKINAPKANESAHSFEPGVFRFRLRIKRDMLDQTLFKEIYSEDVDALIMRYSDDVPSKKRVMKAFRQDEKEFIRNRLSEFLDLAAINIIEDRPDLHSGCAAAVAAAVAVDDEQLSDEARESLCDMKPDKAACKKALNLLTRKSSSNLKIQKNIDRAKDFLESRGKRLEE